MPGLCLRRCWYESNLVHHGSSNREWKGPRNRMGFQLKVQEHLDTVGGVSNGHRDRATIFYFIWACYRAHKTFWVDPFDGWWVICENLLNSEREPASLTSSSSITRNKLSVPQCKGKISRSIICYLDSSPSFELRSLHTVIFKWETKWAAHGVGKIVPLAQAKSILWLEQEL